MHVLVPRSVGKRRLGRPPSHPHLSHARKGQHLALCPIQLGPSRLRSCVRIAPLAMLGGRPLPQLAVLLQLYPGELVQPLGVLARQPRQKSPPSHQAVPSDRVSETVSLMRKSRQGTLHQSQRDHLPVQRLQRLLGPRTDRKWPNPRFSNST